MQTQTIDTQTIDIDNELAELAEAEIAASEIRGSITNDMAEAIAANDMQRAADALDAEIDVANRQIAIMDDVLDRYVAVGYDWTAGETMRQEARRIVDNALEEYKAIRDALDRGGHGVGYGEDWHSPCSPDGVVALSAATTRAEKAGWALFRRAGKLYHDLLDLTQIANSAAATRILKDPDAATLALALDWRLTDRIEQIRAENEEIGAPVRRALEEVREKQGKPAPKLISLDNGNRYMDAHEAFTELRRIQTEDERPNHIDHMWAAIEVMLDDDAMYAAHDAVAPCPRETYLAAYLAIAPHNLIIG